MSNSLTPEQRRLLDEPVQVLGLDVRTTNALEDANYPPVVRTVRDLLQCKADALLQIPNIGEKTISKIFKVLEKRGFYRPEREFARVLQDK